MRCPCTAVFLALRLEQGVGCSVNRRLSPAKLQCHYPTHTPPLFYACLSSRRSKVVTVHGTDDETIPVADAREFAKVLPNNDLAIIEGATHRFSTEREQREVMKVLSRYVEPVPPT